jgi:fibronectin type 3 domain-containing protein
MTGLTAPLTLAAGQTAPLNVKFAPTSAATFNGSIAVASNAPTLTISLTGVGTAAATHSAVLTWTASSTSGVVGYNVYRGTITGGPYTKLNSSSVAVLTFTDSTVVAGQTYFYVVTSVDGSGLESVFSTEVSGTIPTP